jgi:hypothetical protein
MSGTLKTTSPAVSLMAAKTMATQTTPTAASSVGSPLPINPLDVFEYELAMLNAVYGMSQSRVPQGPTGTALDNAITETLVLHTRNLCEIVLPGPSYPDDIRMKDLFQDWDTNTTGIYNAVKSLIGQLDSLYGKSGVQGDARFDFNKRLAHSTKQRAASPGYDYGPHLLSLLPKIAQIALEFEKLRGTSFTSFV